MATILRKIETVHKKVITTVKTPSKSVDNSKLLPKCMVPKKTR